MKPTGRLLRVLGSLRFEGFDTQQHGAIVAGEKRVALLVYLAGGRPGTLTVKGFLAIK